MTDGSAIPETNPAPSEPARRALTALAVGAVGVFAAVLGVRTLTTPDLGYHLAYGDHQLDTGRIVDSGLFVYTNTPAPRPPRDAPGPGCWYDGTGTYRFANANWLSQLLMAAVHRAAGLSGLSVLLAVLVAAILAVGVVTMRRLGLPWLWIAAGTGLTAMVAYERFLLRPEVFGYLVLAGQLCLLIRGRPGWRAAAALVALQLLLVNLHSYFFLGLALTGAALGEAVLRRLWRRLRGPGEANGADRAAARLALVLAAQLAVSFVNPWTWRLVLLPIETLLFLRKHDIAGAASPIEGHPWAIIGEFFRPFAGQIFADRKATGAYCVLLALAAVGVAAAAVRRRWAHVLLIAGMTGVSLSMRRNIAPAALLITPPALAACRELLARIRRVRRAAAWAGMAAAAAIALTAAWGCAAVVTQGFYRNERLSVRFGLGPTRCVMPLGPAEWISRHEPAGRLWTGYNVSSNLHYFTRPHREVPILTNTWASPPANMRRVLDCMIGRLALADAPGGADCQIVALQVNPPLDPRYRPLHRRLLDDPNWALVCLDAAHVVFLRADGENAALARRAAITPQSLSVDLPGFVAGLRRLDPAGGHAVYLGAYTLSNLGWYTQAVDVFREVLDEDPYPHRVWTQIGWCLARRGTRRMLAQPRDFRGINDWREARRCFRQALRLRPGYRQAEVNLRLVEQQLADEPRGVIYKDLF